MLTVNGFHVYGYDNVTLYKSGYPNLKYRTTYEELAAIARRLNKESFRIDAILRDGQIRFVLENGETLFVAPVGIAPKPDEYEIDA